jgi:hypothetical protein
VAFLVIDSLAFRHVVHHWVDLLSQAHAARGCFHENTYKNSSDNNFRIAAFSVFFFKGIILESAGSVLKGLSSEIEGGSKVVSIDRSPFKLPTLCSRFLFYTAAILKFT